MIRECVHDSVKGEGGFNKWLSGRCPDISFAKQTLAKFVRSGFSQWSYEHGVMIYCILSVSIK